MDLKRSSFEFHRQLESPSGFLRREWKPIAMCGGLFSVAMLACIAFIDPAFFYPRLQTDPLNYYLKAKSIAETGSAAATWAVNLKPFAYVTMPGLLRVPMVMAFPDFDDQLRAIQVVNVALLATVALMSAYVFSWMVPRSRHSLVIAFAFVFTLLSPIWVANIFLPLADAPYAAATLAAIFVGLELVTSTQRIIHRPLLTALVVVLFALAFLLRFTAPVLMLFFAPLALARWRQDGATRKALWQVGAIAAVSIALLVSFNLDAIFGRYFREPILFLRKGEKIGMLVNVIGAAIPSQIVPTFQLGFLHPPISDIYSTTFSNAPQDIAWACVGIFISCIVIAGMWFSRQRMLPEILYLLAGLPVIGLMMPSTTRYLMSYQPFFWIFFYVGAATLSHRHAPVIVRLVRSRRAVVAGVVIAAAGIIGLRAWKVAGTASERYFAVTAGHITTYVTDVSDTFRSLRHFVEGLPKEKTLLIGTRGSLGRWKAISDRNYYYPDSALSEMVENNDVYLLIECGTLEACQAWDKWRSQTEERLQTFGDFRYESVFAASSGRARVEALRMSIAQ